MKIKNTRKTETDIISKHSLPHYAEAMLAYDEKRQLPVEFEKIIPYSMALDAIQWIISKVAIDAGFVSYPVYRVLERLLFVKYYSNFDMTELDSPELTPERLYEIYDIVTVSGIAAQIEENIDQEQKNFILKTTEETIKSILTYNNSAAGIIENMIAKAENVEHLSKALETLENKEQFSLVQKILQQEMPAT